jgi:hypothetical protein
MPIAAWKCLRAALLDGRCGFAANQVEPRGASARVEPEAARPLAGELEGDGVGRDVPRLREGAAQEARSKLCEQQVECARV